MAAKCLWICAPSETRDQRQDQNQALKTEQDKWHRQRKPDHSMGNRTSRKQEYSNLYQNHVCSRNYFHKFSPANPNLERGEEKILTPLAPRTPLLGIPGVLTQEELLLTMCRPMSDAQGLIRQSQSDRKINFPFTLLSSLGWTK